MRHHLILLLLLLLCVGFIPQSAAIVNIDQGREQVIIYALPHSFDEYSIYTAKEYQNKQWTSAVYTGLIKRSSANNRGWVASAAVALPNLSDDNLTYTFELRASLYFSNGEPLNLEDVEFSMKVALTPAINKASYSKYYGFLDNNSLTVVSSTTIRITLLQTSAFPYELLSFPLIPEETFGERYENCRAQVVNDCSWNGEDGSDAISAGPYKVTDIDNTNEIVTVEANPFWWDVDSLKTDKIIFQKITEKQAAISSLADGSIHILDSQYIAGLTELDSLGSGITQAFVGAPLSEEISLNHKHPWFGTGEAIQDMNGASGVNYTASKMLRRAMSHVVDRNTYVTEIMDGLAQPAATTMPSASLGWNPAILPDPYDIDQAKSIMESIGFVFSTLGAPNATTGAYTQFFFSITVLSPNDNPARNQWVADYVRQLPKIGIDVNEHINANRSEVIAKTSGSLINPLLYENGGFDIVFMDYTWELDWNPSGLYDASGSCNLGSCDNFYNFDLNESITPMAVAISDYLTELDSDIRLQKATVIQQLIYEWLPAIPILYPQSHFAWSSDVTGIDSLLISLSFQEWDQVYRAGLSYYDPPGRTIDEPVPTPRIDILRVLSFIPLLILVLVIIYLAYKKFPRRSPNLTREKLGINNSRKSKKHWVELMCISCETGNPVGSKYCCACGTRVTKSSTVIS